MKSKWKKLTEDIALKERIISLYLKYLIGYYFITRLLFFILIISLERKLLSFWLVEFIFPLYFSIINLIGVKFINIYLKEIHESKLNEIIKKKLFFTFPNKYVFLITIIIFPLYAIIGLLLGRYENYSYYPIIGFFSFFLNRLELFQNFLMLPILISSFASIMHTPLILKKSRAAYNIDNQVISDFQKLSLNTLEIYIFSILIYLILVLFNITTESLPLTILVIVGYLTTVILSLKLFKQAFNVAIQKKVPQAIEHEVRQAIYQDLQKVCQKFDTWESFMEILDNNLKFNEFFKNLFDHNNDVSSFKNYFKQNKSKNKIKILLFIIAHFLIKSKNCIAQDISNQIKIPKQTISNSITALENEGLIIRSQINKPYQKTLIPNF